MGFADQIEAIVRRIPRDRQTLLFSATMPSGIKALARAYMREPVEVSVGPTMSAVERCKQELYSCTPREKPTLVQWILRREEGQTLIFCRTKRGADQLERVLRHAGHNVGVLHADRTQQERNRSLQRFREGSVRVLVATDLASRGLDVDGIARVINYDVPPTAEDYLHRIGRTARVQREGTASTFATLEDLAPVRAIESVTKQRIPTIFVKQEELLALARELSAKEWEQRPERAHAPRADHAHPPARPRSEHPRPARAHADGRHPEHPRPPHARQDHPRSEHPRTEHSRTEHPRTEPVRPPAAHEPAGATSGRRRRRDPDQAPRRRRAPRPH
jgi:ATP-dependent RNA helicase RhlE